MPVPVVLSASNGLALSLPRKCAGPFTRTERAQMQDGDTFTEADVSALLKKRSLELPFTVKELMRLW
jgi:hypothetical protein